jgi:hypothetical protein
MLFPPKMCRNDLQLTLKLDTTTRRVTQTVVNQKIERTPERSLMVNITRYLCGLWVRTRQPVFSSATMWNKVVPVDENFEHTRNIFGLA